MKQILFILFFNLFFLNTSMAYSDFASTLRAARQGDVDAMIDVGLAYYYGDQTLKDPFTAKCWIQTAYNRGSKEARKIWEDLELYKYTGKCDQLLDDVIVHRHAGGDEYIEPVTGMRFIRVPRGCFKMGCHPAAKDCSRPEEPAFTACLDGFWIGAYEVDQALWTRITGTNPSRFSSHPDHPVENVSFTDVERFIKTLNRLSRDRFSLPTEAQWESACRSGGKPVNFPFKGDGRRPDANCGNCDTKGIHGRTAPVGSYYPSELGIYDMGGNVKEWCLDYYDKNAYEYLEKENPEYRKKKSRRVVRGGSYLDNTRKLRCTARDSAAPSVRADNIGFRLVLIRKI